MHSCQRVHQALGRLLDAQSSIELHRLDAKGLEELYAQRVMDTQMDFHDFVSVEKNKRNQGRFRGRTYFVRFIKELHESGELYGHRRYTPLGRLTITGSVAADQESFFTPCSYGVSGVRSLRGPWPKDLREIVSFRGRFCEQARTGESIMASGTLERVHNRQGEMWHRLLLGNFPEDTMVARR
jgi:predicted nucleotidyltransferase